MQANEAFKRLPVRMSCGALESSSEEVKAFEAADAARADAERAFAFDADALERWVGWVGGRASGRPALGALERCGG